MSSEIGKTVLLLSLGLALFGCILWVVGGLVPFGRLPGDIVAGDEPLTMLFPLTTAIVFSLVLSGLYWLLGRTDR
jgi:hypothetical protein